MCKKSTKTDKAIIREILAPHLLQKEGHELSLYGDMAQFTRVLGNETKHQEQATQPRQGHVVSYRHEKIKVMYSKYTVGYNDFNNLVMQTL
jgi:hypothetical protein